MNRKNYNTVEYLKSFALFGRTVKGVTVALALLLGGQAAAQSEHVKVDGNVFGGGNAAPVTGTSTVTLQDNAAVGSSVFGGGNLAGVSGTATVNIEGGTVGAAHGTEAGVYGGCNSNGAVTGAISVNIKGGTLGTETYPLKGIFGGGYGAPTTTGNNVTVTIGTASNNPTVWGDIYGGSALGQVNASTSNTTKIDFVKGTVNGSVYGGGLGKKETTASTDANGVYLYDADSIAAIVNGNIEVNIGQSGDEAAIDGNSVSITGSVFGCNNYCGGPLGNVEVHIWGTSHTDANKAIATASLSGLSDTTDNVDSPYALGAVYGGGNLAHYTPAKAASGQPYKRTMVHVHGCFNTIKYVYGGGNAANTPADSVIIDGGRFYRIFGGGNGEVATRPAANVTEGNAYTLVKGGVFTYIFGGSNTKGDIARNVVLNVDQSQGSCGLEIVGNLYGGGNLAPGKGGSLTVNCGNIVLGNVYGGANAAYVDGDLTLNMYGGTGIEYVFGGSREVPAEAHDANGYAINGNVTLNLYGGEFVNAFGGSDARGNIKGTITVNVADAGDKDCPLKAQNVYGGGQNAPYTPQAASRTGSPAVYVTNTTSHAEAASPYNKVLYNVFGGGLGTGATVTASPAVYIGADGGTTTAKVGNNVYGGGEEANVVGDATVTIRHSNTVVAGNVFGAGKGLETTAADDQKVAAVSGNTAVSMTDGTVKGNIYGGGEMASVGVYTYDASGLVTGHTGGGITTVSISGGTVGVEEPDYTKVGTTAQVTGGTATREYGHTVGHKGHVFGAGLGKAGSAYAGYAYVDTAQVNISGTAFVVGSVFGGGENGHVQHNSGVHMSGGTVGQLLTYTEREIDPVTGAPLHHIYLGNIYGGGRGIDAVDNHFTLTEGRVFGNTHVVVSGGQVRHAVYGGGSLASVGTYHQHTDGTHRYVSGTGEAHVTIEGTAWIGHTGVDLEDHATVDRAEYFLGTGKTAVDLINENYRYLGSNCGMVYGSGRGLSSNDGESAVPAEEKAAAAFTSATHVTLRGNAMVCGSVFGGGENGHVQYDTYVTIAGGTVGGIPMHNDNFQTKARGFYTGSGSGTTLNNYYEDTEDETGVGPAVYRGNVYGGGRGVDHFGGTVAAGFSATAGRVYGNTNVTVSGGTVYHHVFGGGSIASVGTYNDNTAPTAAQEISIYATLADAESGTASSTQSTGHTNVTINGGQIGSMGWNEGSVFGGGRGIAGEQTWQVTHLAFVNTAEVEIQPGAAVMGSVFGGGANGHVLDSTLVHITGGIVGHPLEEDDTLTTVYGYAPRTVFRGNVYGGGRGVDPLGPHNLSRTAGRVYGNTHVLMEGGWVRHSVFGGGSMASVGDYDTMTANGIYRNMELETGDVKDLKEGRDSNFCGRAWVEITGGYVGSQHVGFDYADAEGAGKSYPLVATATGDISMAAGQGGEGRNNGRVFGSCRGTAGEGYDNLAYVNITRVIIGTAGSASGPKIMGCVFGSGENGHVLDSTYVQMHSGEIGRGKVYDWKRTYIGNLYGGGRGIDLDHNNRLSKTAGWVRGSTRVEMTGGHVWHNVYGGGSLASVGPIVETPTYKTTYDIAQRNGRATIHIVGGKVGQDGLYGGNVFGSGRGRAGLNIDTVFHLCNSACIYSPATTEATTGTVNIKGTTYDVRKLKKLSDPSEDSLTLIVIRSKVDPRASGLTLGAGNPRNYADSIYYIVSGDSILTTWHDFSNRTNVHNAQVIINMPYLNKNTLATTTIDTATNRICGSVYGSGDNGHVLNRTYVGIHGGMIGTRFDGFDDAMRDNILARYPIADRATISANIATTGIVLTGGSVYGSGRGLDLTNVGDRMSPTAGRVYGHTKVVVTGGKLLRNVYGGGNMAGVGVGTTDGSVNKEITNFNAASGTATVLIYGGTIGEDHTIEPDNRMAGGNVFGSSRGLSSNDDLMKNMAFVRQTYVFLHDTMATTAVDPVYSGDADDVKARFTVVTAAGGATVHGSVFGGGENGHVWHDTYVDLSGSTTIGLDADNNYNSTSYSGNLYGGGRGIDLTTTNAIDRRSGVVYGNTHVTISGGTVYHHVFGGGSVASVGRYIFYDQASTDMQNAAEYHNDDYVIRAATAADFQAGGLRAASGITPGIDSWGQTTVTISGGQIGINGQNNGRVFGAGRGIAGLDANGNAFNFYTFVAGTTVNIESGADVRGCVFGSGDNGHVTGNTEVNVSGGTVGSALAADGSYDPNGTKGGPLNGNVFGGGRGADRGRCIDGCGDDNIYHYSPMAGRVRGTTTVNITGGEIYNNVYGGGFMANVAQGTTVNIGNSSSGTPADLTILGDVFGGSALGPIGSTGNTTTVNIFSGTIGSATEGYNAGNKGNIFGGGNGEIERNDTKTWYDVAVFEDGQATARDADNKRDADVLNTVHVNIGTSAAVGNAVVKGYVFGGNNIAGCPKDLIYVDVWKTNHSGANEYPDLPGSAADPYDDDPDAADVTALTSNDAAFALKGVYGGGNQAAYSTDLTTATTQVTVHGCLNTIKYVYGGGKAADTKANKVDIEGGLIYQVYGGGDGSVEGTQANVDGDAITTIKGGLIAGVFGGSNTRGVVNGVATVTITDEPTCARVVNEVFGGGNEAPGGDVVVTIPCGATGLTDVYGGAKNADIGTSLNHKNIVLNIYGGDMTNVYGGNMSGGTVYGNVKVNVNGANPDHTISNVFGGSNLGGSILGDIVVRINDSIRTCPLKVANVYGGGNEVAYNPTFATGNVPSVQLINGTVDNDVFGGGLGSSATVTANPQVIIGSDGTNAAYDTYPAVEHTFAVKGNVYGGGSAAPVIGNTMVKLTSSPDHDVVIGTSADAVDAFGGYPSSNGNLFGGGLGATATVDGNTSVGVFGNRTTVYHNVYGGGSAGKVMGTTDVQVGADAAFTMALPNIAISPGGMVSLASTTPGASFRYNIGDDAPADPTTESGTLYTTPFQATAGQIIKAIAYRDGYTASAVATSAAVPIPVPTVSSDGTTATVTPNTTNGPADQTLYYTLDGSAPDPATANTYTTSVAVASGNVMKVIATKSGYTQSAVAYTTVATPVITITDGNASITCGTAGATIRYVLGEEDSENAGQYLEPAAPTAWTTDGSTTYTTPVAIAAGQTIKVIADLPGYAPSAVATKTRVVTP